MNLEYCIWEVVIGVSQEDDFPTIDKIYSVFENPKSCSYDVSPYVINHLKVHSYKKSTILTTIKKMADKEDRIYNDDGFYYYYKKTAWRKTKPLREYLSHQKGKSFSEKYLLKMCDWEAETTFVPKMHLIIDGWSFPCSSYNEENALTILLGSGFAKTIRGQKFAIEYKKRGRVKYYYPDIVFLTIDNRICFLEIKPLSDMVDEKNRRKYRFLETYCKKHGYLYATTNGNLETFEWLADFTEAIHSSRYSFKDAIEDTLRSILDRDLDNCYDDIQQLINEYKQQFVEQRVKDWIAYFIYKHNLYCKGNFSGSKRLIIKRKRNSTL